MESVTTFSLAERLAAVRDARFGLHCLAEPHRKSCVVFVHGLGGHVVDTWDQFPSLIMTDIDIPAFQKATASVYTAFPKWTPGLRETVLANLK